MTTTSMVIVGFVIVAVLFGLEISWKSWQSGRAFCTPLPRPYRDRQSQETAWRQRYAEDAMEHADTVLKLICEAFCFNPDNRYLFAPDDRMLDIYRGVYPRRWFGQGADCMEIETLGITLEKRFGFGVSEWHENITIGEIVDAIASNGAGADVNLPIS